QAIQTNYYQSIAKVPLAIGIDAEWGLGMRLDSTMSFPRQLPLGAIRDNSLIYDMGAEIAKQCRRIGVHINFAPCIDVNNNPMNPVINSRSFGEDIYNVTRKGFQYMRGMQDYRVLAVGKHFPGHGDTDVDSHYGLPVIKHDKKRLDSLEMFPFRRMIDYGIGGMMIAHLSIPALERKTNVPSTLSYSIVTNLLKNKLGFEGLIFTDALNMQGVTKNLLPGDIEIAAINAGNDVLLFPQNVPIAVEAVKNAVTKGKISQNVIYDRCKKILMFKRWLALDSYQPVNTECIIEDLHSPEALLLNRRLIEATITVLDIPNNIVPLKRTDTLSILSVAFGAKRENMFQKRMLDYADIDTIIIPKDLSQRSALDKRLSNYNTIIISVHQTNNNPGKRYGYSQDLVKYIQEIATKHNVILCLFSNPYSLSYFNTELYKGIVLGQTDDSLYHDYTAQAMFGGIQLKSKLPVTVSSQLKVGNGIYLSQPYRFKFTIPQDIGINPIILNNIDTIAEWSIREGVTPGCQIFFAVKGAVVYNKSFGYHTYDKTTKVENNHLYDLASITKVAATTLAVMKLFDEDKIRLEDSLCMFFSAADTTNKASITILDLLTHQGRLRSWIPFHLYTIKGYADKDKNVVNNKKNSKFSIRAGNGNEYLAPTYKFYDSTFSKQYSDRFSIQIGDSLYLHKKWKDSVWTRIWNSPLYTNKKYVYSDLDFIFLKEIVEQVSNRKLDEYVWNEFYKPMGLKTLCFNPYQKFPKERIVPTEVDIVFRKQTIRGYVHDPTAAMFGGVSGHAGLFGTAYDVGKLFQMILNSGMYAGEQLIREETVDLFTSCYNCKENFRGLGFARIEPNKEVRSSVSRYTSVNSFGHTGFTGTIAWVDADKEIVFVYLSNRVHPNTDNWKINQLFIRELIHTQIYRALQKPEIFINPGK
ncbi:MAG: glycoside hydrolase family 3 N-terminal domain-containing protein, partial [Bacteroidales bacterium]